ncbi:MAG: hypothetical protein J1E35_08310 [Lachnospiraceae bacterium]|nr:hypothetical protein [Lachnospiraceae bacterium]
MEKVELEKLYKDLFPSEKEKAAAFDEIAKQFYFCNFGTMQKSDIETLLFSLYLDRILEMSEEDMQSYSDYTLSKYLGITQNKVSALKVRKELKYPYPKFDWKKSFACISKNARYENGKIKIHIPDKNLYFEIKNAIESMGGYVDVQLNSTLLQVSPEYFLDLILKISDEADREVLIKKLNEEFHERKISIEAIEKELMGTRLKECGCDTVVEIIIGMAEFFISKDISVFGQLFSNVARAIKDGLKRSK